MNFLNVAWGVGSVVVCVMALYIIPDYGWKTFVAACAMPLVIALIGLLWLVESPRWLLVTGNVEGAMKGNLTVDIFMSQNTWKILEC